MNNTFPLQPVQSIKKEIGGIELELSITARSLEIASQKGIDISVLDGGIDEVSGQFTLLIDFLFIALCAHYPDLTRDQLASAIGIEHMDALSDVLKELTVRYIGVDEKQEQAEGKATGEEMESLPKN